MSRMRIAAGLLALSASAFVGIVTHEGYSSQAIIPTKGDRPTLGVGSTVYADGSAVRMGDGITPVRAIVLAMKHISKQEKLFRESIQDVPLQQAEYDLYVDWVYQYGIGNWMRSSMRRALLAGDYDGACAALLLFKKSGGYDCSTPGNTICAGVWTRQLERHRRCMEVQ